MRWIWLACVLSASVPLIAQQVGLPRDLPLIEVPATGKAGDTFAVLVSGDGGWAAIDQSISKALAAEGIPVVGWNSLRYFWKKRSPDEVGHDLTRVIRAYSAAWKRPRVVLIGYSRGADVLPLMASRLPVDVAKRVRLMALFAPSLSVELEFHVGDWWSDSSKGFPLVPEVRKLGAMPLLCVHGSEEKDSLCLALPPGSARAVVVPGSHHFDGQYGKLATLVLDAMAVRK